MLVFCRSNGWSTCSLLLRIHLNSVVSVALNNIVVIKVSPGHYLHRLLEVVDDLLPSKDLTILVHSR